MAKCYVSGIDELAMELKKLGQLDNDKLVEEMLEAGADVVIDEWKEGIKKAVKNKRGRSTGELLESVTTNKGIDKVGDVSAKTIYHAGKDSKGVRNAEKAFILHYGKSGQAPTLFVDDVEAVAEDKAAEAMEQVFNDYLEKEGL
ncbi:MAG: HK97-gp10 family putative phage morphogenesis protein [Oscillospiraceae bacterium]